MNEKIRLRLLGELIDAIQDGKRPHNLINHLYVHFFTKRGRLVSDELGVAKALDCLFNNVYSFEDFDLSEAEKLEVHSQ